MNYLDLISEANDNLNGLSPPSYSEVENLPSIYIIRIAAHQDDVPPPSYEEAVIATIIKEK